MAFKRFRKRRTNVLALGLENPNHIVILDDALARRIGQAAGLKIWGTLRVLLEAKSHGIIKNVDPFIKQLEKNGMWISSEIRQRILALADEKE